MISSYPDSETINSTVSTIEVSPWWGTNKKHKKILNILPSMLSSATINTIMLQKCK
jgi:hypothetical protein